jgi:pyridoxamine 5'-phosphate oxidase
MKKTNIAKLNRQYHDQELSEKTVPGDPLRLFHHWFTAAVKARVLDPHAMALSTTGAAGKPTARMVLLKNLDDQGFIFFTNYLSRKGKELKRHPQAGLLFFWAPMSRQVRVEGKVKKLSARESDEYFKTRPRGSQLSAWASHQSEVVESREALEERMRELGKKYRHKKIPRPPYWGGYRVVPDSIEFWSGRLDRLHDRLLYQRKDGGWNLKRLAP